MTRRIAQVELIALRAEACRLAQFILGCEATKAQHIEWIEFYERVQIEGAKSLEGVYAAPVVPALRLVPVAQ